MKMRLILTALILSVLQYASPRDIDSCLSVINTEFSDSLSNDSIASKQLKEMVVEHESIRMSVNKSEYFPTKSQRNSSINGQMLLHQLAISELQIDPLSGEVKTTSGEKVAYFIDGVPAMTNEVSDLNTRDVVRVDVMDYPNDPVFRNEPHVVNFVMRKYVYGGYAKLNNNEMLLNSFSTATILTAKTAYKKMTYDIRGGYRHLYNPHLGIEGSEWFDLAAYKAIAPNGITRTSRLDDSKSISDKSEASFRALYEDDKTQLSSTISWVLNDNPERMMRGSVKYYPEIFSERLWHDSYPMKTNSISWANRFYKILPKSWALSLDLTTSYDHVNQRNLSVEGNVDIRNTVIRENIFANELYAMLAKRFSQNHTLSFRTYMATQKSDIKYSGARGDNTVIEHTSVSPVLAYTYTHSEKLVSALELSTIIYHGKVSKIKETEIRPYVMWNIQWMPHQRHRFGLLLYTSVGTPSLAQNNPVLVQTDLFKWTQGNALLKPYQTYKTQIRYTWMPNQRFVIAPVFEYTYMPKYYDDTYSLTDDGKGILVRPEYCGNFRYMKATANISSYLLKRKLVLQVQPVFSSYHFGAGNRKWRNTPCATINATYYARRFFLGCSYSTPRKSYDRGYFIERKIKSDFWITGGWGNSSCNVQIYIVNPFRNNWNCSTTLIDTENYMMRNTEIGNGAHRRINIQLAYTFGYGKKIDRGDELYGISGSSSAIR